MGQLSISKNLEIFNLKKPSVKNSKATGYYAM